MTLYVTKRAGEAKDFTIDWTSRGLGSDTITSHSFSVQPNGLTLNTNPAPSHTEMTSTFWVSGGQRNRAYTVLASVGTQSGRTLEEEINVFVEP